jgi:hypothetical protein
MRQEKEMDTRSDASFAYRMHIARARVVRHPFKHGAVVPVFVHSQSKKC